MKEKVQLSEQDQEAREMYLQTFLQRLEKDKASLTPHEQRLGEKYLFLKGEADRFRKDCEQLQNQIQQAQARLNSLELQFQATAGRAGGILESIVEIEMMSQESLKKLKDEVTKLEKSPDKAQAEPAVETPSAN